MSYVNLNDSHNPSSTEVFLDTSIHCALLKGRHFRTRVAAVLALFSWKGTSTYAKVEFGNVVLAEAEYFLTLLDRYPSLEDALDYVGNVLNQKRWGKKVTWSFNLLRNHYGANDEECTERARLSLRRLLKTGVLLVEANCDQPINDGTQCYWAKKGVHRRKDGKLEWISPNCKRNKKRCKVDDFFQDNRDTFEKIKNAIDLLPEEKLSDQLRAFSKIIGEAMIDPKCLLDYRTGCRKLADAIIAVDSRSFGSMFSQNSEESGILTSVLSQTFYYLPPNPENGVLIQLADVSS